MTRSSRLLALAAALLMPAAAHAGEFVDTRIVFLFSDDNVFAGPADFSPQPDFGPREDVDLFYDNYNTRDSGQVTKTTLGVYRRMVGWHPRIETEAGFVARFELFVDNATGKPQRSYEYADDGTFVQVNWLLGDTTELTETRKAARPPRLYFLGYPFSADRFRLGYSYAITWGGREIIPKNTAPISGMKFGWDGKRAYWFGGMKTSRLLNENTNDLEANYGFLTGAGIDVTESLKIEGGAGFFQRGALPPIGPGDPIAGERINATGVSAQVIYHKGLRFSESVDLKLLRNDPEAPYDAFFKEEKYFDTLGWTVQAEFSYLTHNLRDPDTFGQTVMQPAIVADVNAGARLGNVEAQVTLVYADLAFLLFNVPSFTPYYAFPKDAEVRGMSFISATGLLYLPNLHMKPSVSFGYQTPATYTGDTSGAGLPGSNTVVVRGQGDFEILPPGQGAFDILSFRVADAIELSKMMQVTGQVTYTLDKNATRLVRNSTGFPERVFDDDNVTSQVSFALAFQSRF